MKKDKSKLFIDKRRPMENYSVLTNDITANADLSWEARGLMAYLNGLPEDWQVSLKDIISKGPASRDKSLKMIKELVDAGYIKSIKPHRGMHYYVSQNKDFSVFDIEDSSTIGNYGTVNLATVKSGTVKSNHYKSKHTNKVNNITKKDISNDISKESSKSDETDIFSSANLPVKKDDVISILGEVLGDKSARDVIAHRKSLRKPLTARAAFLLAKRLASAENACGMPPRAAADYMIEKGWQSFDPSWVKTSEWDKVKGYTNEKRQAHEEFRNRLNQAFEGRSARLAKGEVFTALSFPDFSNGNDIKSIGKG